MDYFSKNRFLSRFRHIDKRYDWVLLSLVAVLCVSGLAFLASALSVKNPFDFYREFFYQMIFGVWIGGFGAYILSRIDYHVLFKYKSHLVWITVGLLGFLAVFASYAQIMGMNLLQKDAFIDSFANPIFAPFMANGSVRWVYTPLTKIQPSELAKLAILVFFAGTINKLREEEITWLTLKRPLYAFFLVASLIIVQPDLGSIILIFGILFAAMWICKVPTKILGVITTVLLVFGLISSIGTAYRFSRIKAAYDRENATSSEVYQIVNAQSAIKNGGFWGLGYGNSQSKQNGSVPESTTDAIIAIIGEEMGFLFTIGFLSLYLGIAYRGYRIAKEAPDNGGKALAIGITFWIVSQAFLNVAGILGIVPLKGLPLPFVSEGGTSMVLNLASVGILMNISSHRASVSQAYSVHQVPNSLKVRKNMSRRLQKT
jgi:cell division protein FtsW